MNNKKASIEGTTVAELENKLRNKINQIK